MRPTLRITRLDPRHEGSLERLLLTEPLVNLFLLGLLETQGVDFPHWYGAIDGTTVLATVLVVHGRLAVPYGLDPAHLRALGEHIARHHPPCMVVGPRVACDALWQAWAPGVATRCYFDQRLYVVDQVGPAEPIAGFRKAAPDDWRELSVNAGLMEYEDLGQNPAETEPAQHENGVRQRIRDGRTYVIERNGTIVFQINVGTVNRRGCQVGGTYVPPEYRGQGIATEGMREIARLLLQRSPAVTLHVNEANVFAVRAYERAGFHAAAAFRLITCMP